MARKMLRNDQWNKLKDLLPGKVTDCGVTAADTPPVSGSGAVDHAHGRSLARFA